MGSSSEEKASPQTIKNAPDSKQQDPEEKSKITKDLVIDEIKLEGRKIVISVRDTLQSIAFPLLYSIIATAMLSVLFYFLFDAVQNLDLNAPGEDDDFAEGLGSAAVNFVWIGALYFFLRRIYEIIRGLDKAKYGDIQKESIKWYRKLRKPLLWIHNISLIIATILGLVHGLFLLDDDFGVVYTGVFAVLFMVLLSTSGLIIYYKYRPIWNKRQIKGAVRYVHRQWVYSLLFVIYILLHTSMA